MARYGCDGCDSVNLGVNAHVKFEAAAHDAISVFLNRIQYEVTFVTSHVTNLPCPSSKQAVNGSIVALKRRAHDFMGQQRSDGDQQMTHDDDAGLSYLESVDKYKYNTLAVGWMIVQ
jgi:hypothetical protein